MGKHETALVPLEAWSYSSPSLLAAGKRIDIGLLAEALLYYERILLQVTNHEQLAAVLEWVSASGHFDAFLRVLQEGVISVYDYSFFTAPFDSGGVFTLVNVQDPIQATYGTFPRRFLYQPSIEDVIPNARRRKRLYDAVKNRVIEAKADDFGPSVENARSDFEDPRRSSILVQAFVDEVYRYRSLGRPPQVSSRITKTADGARTTTTWNVNFEELNRLAGTNVNFQVSTPLVGAAHCNRLLASASQIKCDLFLGSPMSSLVGDKLYEVVRTPARTSEIIVQLKERVEFPDVRELVNSGKLTLADVLVIRGKAERFRRWLQSEAERDRDAIVAYHHEVAQQAGLEKFGRKLLNLFGVAGGGALGAGVGQMVGGTEGAALGGALGAGTTFLADVGARLGTDWRPSVFGTWLSDHIERYSRGET